MKGTLYPSLEPGKSPGEVHCRHDLLPELNKLYSDHEKMHTAFGDSTEIYNMNSNSSC